MPVSEHTTLIYVLGSDPFFCFDCQWWESQLCRWQGHFQKGDRLGPKFLRSALPFFPLPIQDRLAVKINFLLNDLVARLDFILSYATSKFPFLASKNSKMAVLGARICTYHSHLCFRERSFFSVLIINDGNRNFVGDRGTSKKEIDWVQNSSGLLCLFFLSQYKID